MSCNDRGLVGCLFDAAGLGAVAGLSAGALDGVFAWQALGAPTVPAGDALSVMLTAVGLAGLGGALAAALVAAAARVAGRGRAVVALLVAAPFVALNLGLAGRLGPAGWGGLAGATLAFGAAGMVIDRLHRAGRGHWLAPVALVVALAATGANATLFPGLYRPQHATLALLALGALIWAALAVGGRVRWFVRVARGTLGVAALAAAAALAGVPVAPGANARVILERDTLVATHVVDAVTALSDWDGDGYSSLLGGADCGPADATVHPGAADLPDDGVDQDCLGGDTTRARLAALGALRASLADTATPPTPARPLIVLSIDALRADRSAGMTGVQQLASRGVSFARAYVPYPSTILSFTSMLTGRAPSAIATKRVLKWDVPLPETSETLAEGLAAAGYTTVGLFFHHLFAPAYGITRGFQDVWVAGSDPKVVVWGVSSAETADRALQALSTLGRAGRPFFLWVHFYDPHEPYVVHPDEPVADVSDYGQLYDGEVRFTDRHLTRLVDALVTDGWTDRALIVLLADHGESLGEGGRLFHNSALTEEQVHVPLVVVAPGLPRGETRTTPVSLQDLPDTLTAELGLPRLRDSQGASFRRLLREPDPPPEHAVPIFFEVYADAGVQKGVMLGPWKLVQHLRTGALELTDVVRDPFERLNVVDLVPEIAQDLAEKLSTWGAATAIPAHR